MDCINSADTLDIAVTARKAETPALHINRAGYEKVKALCAGFNRILEENEVASLDIVIDDELNTVFRIRCGEFCNYGVVNEVLSFVDNAVKIGMCNDEEDGYTLCMDFVMPSVFDRK